MQNALRQLADEARREAALIAMGSPEHAFYEGVVVAAEDRLHLARRELHDDRWLAAQTPHFREGYVKASDIIATAGHAPVRLYLPSRTT
jgi:hypothetical protein